MKKFNVIEDNGGGLTLVIFAKNETIDYLHTGYQYSPGQLKQDLAELSSNNVPLSMWDGNELFTLALDSPNRIETWFPADREGIDWNIVADNDGIYPDVMGIAAHKELVGSKGELKWA